MRADLLPDGVVQLNNASWVKGMLQQYDPCAINVVYERRKNSKSAEQLGYLWGVVYPEISRHTGHAPEELHSIFKAKYLKQKVAWRGGDMYTVGGLGNATLGETAEFITNVVNEANELGIEVPEPDKLYQFKD